MGGTLKIVHFADFDKCDRFFPIYLKDVKVERFREANELLDMAEKFIRSGEIRAAIFMMRQAVRAVPDEPKIFNICAGFFYLASRYEEMAECLTCAIGLAPKNPYLHIHRAWAWAQLGNFKEARKDAWNALRLSENRAEERAYCFYRAGIIEFLDKKYMAAAIYFWRTANAAPFDENYKMCGKIAMALKQKHEEIKKKEERPLVVLA